MAIILYDVYAMEHRNTPGMILRFAAPGVIHSIRLRGQTMPIHLQCRLESINWVFM